MLVEAELLLVEGEQLQHDSVLVVLVRISRCAKNACDELVQSVIGRGERWVQLGSDNGNRVLVLTVQGVVPHCRVGAVEFEHVLRIVDVAVPLNPLDGHLLHGATVSHGGLLEGSQRVIENLLMYVGQSDTHDEGVHELVVVLSVHGVEQRIHGGADTLLRCLRDTLLVVVGGVEPDVVEDGYVIGCHLHYLLGSVLDRQVHLVERDEAVIREVRLHAALGLGSLAHDSARIYKNRLRIGERLQLAHD